MRRATLPSRAEPEVERSGYQLNSTKRGFMVGGLHVTRHGDASGRCPAPLLSLVVAVDSLIAYFKGRTSDRCGADADAFGRFTTTKRGRKRLRQSSQLESFLRRRELGGR